VEKSEAAALVSHWQELCSPRNDIAMVKVAEQANRGKKMAS